MEKLKYINTSLLVFLFGISTFAVAQEVKTDISNGDGEVCPYLQYEPKEGDLFNRDETAPHYDCLVRRIQLYGLHGRQQNESC